MKLRDLASSCSCLKRLSIGHHPLPFSCPPENSAYAWRHQVLRNTKDLEVLRTKYFKTWSRNTKYKYSFTVSIFTCRVQQSLLVVFLSIRFIHSLSSSHLLEQVRYHFIQVTSWLTGNIGVHFRKPFQWGDGLTAIVSMNESSTRTRISPWTSRLHVPNHSHC